MPQKKSSGKRNYSFVNNSKLLEDSKLKVINGIKIPAMPGTCTHAILCSLAHNKNKFCSWEYIFKNVKIFMIKYGGPESWNKYVNRANASKPTEERVKDSTYALTRTGQNPYGRKVHERGCVVYYFGDGAVLYTGGEFKENEDGSYELVFPDGKGLQTRHRGISLLYREYIRMLKVGCIDPSGNILDKKLFNKVRTDYELHGVYDDEDESSVPEMLDVSVTLKETYDQSTAFRLQDLGFVAAQAHNNVLMGKVAQDKAEDLSNDPDVEKVSLIQLF